MGFDRTQKNTLKQLYVQKIIAIIRMVTGKHIGIVDYKAGLVTLNDFGPIQVDNDLGQLTVTINPATTVISSSYNRIITIDPFDPTAITVKVTAKS